MMEPPGELQFVRDRLSSIEKRQDATDLAIKTGFDSVLAKIDEKDQQGRALIDSRHRENREEIDGIRRDMGLAARKTDERVAQAGRVPWGTLAAWAMVALMVVLWISDRNTGAMANAMKSMADLATAQRDGDRRENAISTTHAREIADLKTEFGREVGTIKEAFERERVDLLKQLSEQDRGQLRSEISRNREVVENHAARMVRNEAAIEALGNRIDFVQILQAIEYQERTGKSLPSPMLPSRPTATTTNP